MYHYTSFHFQLFECLATIPSKNNVRSAPACTALTYVAITCAPQIIPYAVTDKGMRTKVSFGRTMMQAWSCCGWQKGTSLDKARLNSKEIKPVVIAIIELRLFEGIREGGSESVNRKFDKIENY